MKKVPSSVRVGYIDFEIIVCPNLNSSAPDGQWGACNKEQFKIYLAEDQPSQQMAETLLHEILHAIWYARSMKDEAEEEKAVTELSIGLATVIRDNPKVMKWIEDRLNGV